MLDKNFLIENITEEHILSILEEYGVKPHGAIKTKEIWFRTICHGGKSHKLCYFRDTKTFYCYTSCGQMSLYSLIMKLQNCEFYDAVRFIANKLGYSNRKGINNNSFARVNSEFIEIDRYLSIRRKKHTELKTLPIINGKILKYFEDDVFFKGWIDEGISIDTMEFFGIRWYEIEKHIIIPHENADGELVGIRRRSLQEKDEISKKKYMPSIVAGIMYAHPLGLNLYGLSKYRDCIKRTKKVVLVESEKSVMLAHTFYGDDAFVLSTCGFNITNWQRDTILSLGVEEVILAFDKDFDECDFEDYDENSQEFKDYTKFIERIYSLAHKFTPYCSTYVLWDRDRLLKLKDSPFDKGKEVLEELMRKKVEITTDRNEEK